jgi:AraC-like DNA-binding protein
MEFRQFPPSDILKAYIKCFYIFQSDTDTEFDDTVFPSGNMEIVFNLGNGIWESSIENEFYKTPQIELWGQITKPLAIKSKGKHTMLGIKFLTHSAAYFLNDEVGAFNDRVYDLSHIIGSSVKNLHAQLLENTETKKRIELVENFLIKRLAGSEKKSSRIDKVADILASIRKNETENNLTNIASRHGITPRYLHKLIYRHTGLSPKSLNKINRFQLSLKLMAKNEQPFTSIAYDCGYFDQSHFIRDFKSFTRLTPSGYLESKLTGSQVFLQ